MVITWFVTFYFVCRWWVRSWSPIPEEHHQQWGNDPSQSYCPCEEDPGESCLKTGRVIDIFDGSVFRDVVVTLTHRGLHQLFCIFGPQIESSNKIFLKLNKVPDSGTCIENKYVKGYDPSDVIM